jgi:hypothetical protein
VWCAVSAAGIIRTIFFSETVNGNRYIAQFLAPLFENLAVPLAVQQNSVGVICNIFGT